MRKCRGEPGDGGREGWRALVTRREEGRFREIADPFELEVKLLRIVRLFEEGRRILDSHLPNVRWHRYPGARTERHGLDELFGGAGVVSGGDPLDYGFDLFLNIREQWRQGGVIAEQ